MTKVEKRVAVAKDVLKQIEAGTTIPTSGVYFRPTKVTKEWTAGADAQAAMAAGALKVCHTCALGAALVSFVRLYDGVRVKPGGYLGMASEQLLPLFGRNQLFAIEAAFEGWDGTEDGTDGPWVVRYPNDTPRLVAIMRNIVRNKGTFKPSVR